MVRAVVAGDSAKLPHILLGKCPLPGQDIASLHKHPPFLLRPVATVGNTNWLDWALVNFGIIQNILSKRQQRERNTSRGHHHDPKNQSGASW
jgi:hypothetical protein